jgi:membrane protein
MPSLWKFAGLTPLVLTQRAIKKIREDELSTRSAALSYYFILSLFPMFLFLVSLIGLFSGAGSELRLTIMSALSRLAPGSASGLVRNVVAQTSNSSSHLKAGAGIFGALWAASAGMSAVIESLNVIYRLSETRSWWKQKLTVIGLTVSLAALIIVALVLVLYGGKIGEVIATQVGLGDVFKVAWEVLQWPVTIGAMFFSFSVVYYFGPSVRGHWHWVTPGAALGVATWLLASIGFRVYLKFFNSYSATYGSLGAVIILLLWLYITGAAILMGAELNSVIEDADKATALQASKKQEIESQMRAA